MIFAAALALLLSSEDYPSLDLHFIGSGAIAKIGHRFPQTFTLSRTVPDGWKRLPDGATRYGTWLFGHGKIAVVETEEGGKPTGLALDFTGTGDFALAKSISWSSKSLEAGKAVSSSLYEGTVVAPSPFGLKEPVEMSFYRFDPRDPSKDSLKDVVYIYGGYALEGTAKLAGKSYHVMIVDTTSTGEFGCPTPDGSHVPGSLLLIDRDRDGKYDPRYEWYDTHKPFTIDGFTYEITRLHGSGANVGVQRSTKTVPEIPITTTKS